ncbi:endonuclease/exonuclease/phosphatase family protein [Actinomadura fulvescens]|uniref:Endonuclease/exonuclease/phosphatase domain-containing protein n=1 Tax=Actinomadura fulvescens TaxID=46160 RepID=A0ABN3QWD7_9ACTN
MRGMSRAAVLLGVVGTAIALLSGPGSGRDVPDRSVSASTVTAKIHHYNLCQGNDFCGSAAGRQYRQGALNHLRWFAAAEGPWFISVNEVCLRDYKQLRTDLNVNGDFVQTHPDHPRCVDVWGEGNGAYGSAMLAPGGIVEKAKRIELPNPGRNCDEQECRRALCLRAATYAGPMTVCTAHLEPDGELAPKQATAYYKEARLFNAEGGLRRGLVLAGDFNITPGQLPPDYRDLTDLVQAEDTDWSLTGTYPTWTGRGVTAKPTRHIDYIFVERGVGTPRPFPPYCRHPDHPNEHIEASDHCYTKGHWDL